jgi:cell division protein FtsB
MQIVKAMMTRQPADRNRPAGDSLEAEVEELVAMITNLDDGQLLSVRYHLELLLAEVRALISNRAREAVLLADRAEEGTS